MQADRPAVTCSRRVRSPSYTARHNMRASIGADTRQAASAFGARRAIGFAGLALVFIILASAAGWWWWQRLSATTRPDIPPLDLSMLFVDATPVTVTFPVGGERVVWHTTADEVRRSVTLWRRMHLADW